ncbi:Zn-finger in Ran binding protein [Musa troglodytarum]|uniref:Zn-finger in Ran binding protein n=1 Tax=Musa troglodytarum TaxID=320322 RepID=A0A9E7EPB4_9LILI|nr:Zn-finger in Ran binding protein [Musa troglodytarum]
MHRVLSPLRVQTRASRRGLAHFLPPPERFLSDPRLGFVCEELRSLDKLPATPPRRPEESSTPARGRSVRGVVEVSHPWPEWVQLMEHLLRKGYLDHSALRVDDASSSSSLSASKDSNLIRTACLNFARDRFDIIRCNFLNFAKNITCLRCNGQFQERFKMLQLQEERGHLPLKKGDWICLKCNFLNFAKNTECLQCHEKPHNRQLNPGEWECISCNYINFRKNTVCLRCDWKRPKAINNGDFARLEHGSQVDNKSYSFSFVRDSDIDAKKLVIQKEDLDFWRSSEDECSDFGDNRFNLWKGFNNFPIIGGRTAVSQDATVRQRWKEKMSRRHQDPSGEGVEESDHDVASATPSPMDLDNCSSEDDTAEWFGSGKLSHGFNKSSV